MAQKTVNQELIKRFSAVFRDSGLTQAVFGKRIGQKQNAIAQVLGGDREPSKPMLRAIITEFDISPGYLYGESEEMRAPAKASQVSAQEIGDLKAALKAHIEYWRDGEERVLKRLAALDQRLAQLEKRLDD